MISVSTRVCYKCILHPLAEAVFSYKYGHWHRDVGEHLSITLLHSPTSSMPKIGAKENKPNKLRPNDCCQLDVAEVFGFHSTENYGLMLSGQKNKSYHIPKFFHKPTIHTEVAPSRELQTTILIEDACVDTDARLQPHTIGTIWKNG